jgi:hypothetical protein
MPSSTRARSATERTHLASSPDPIELYAVDQLIEPGMKPLGLWYEVDGDWRRWIEGEQFRLEAYTFAHRLELGAERMLFVRGSRELEAFNAEYEARELSVRGTLNWRIDWPRVAEEYDGIEIAPYVWSHRLDYLWYYGWDCASGCIWRPRGAHLEAP